MGFKCLLAELDVFKGVVHCAVKEHQHSTFSLVFQTPSPGMAREGAHLWFEIVYDWLNFQLSIVLIVLPHTSKILVCYE